MRALQHFVLFAVVAYGFAIGSGGDFRRSWGRPKVVQGRQRKGRCADL